MKRMFDHRAGAGRHAPQLVGCIFLGMASLLGLARGDESDAPARWASDHVERLLPIYYELHRAPELSFHEEKTADRLARELRAAGFDVTTGIGGHGVVGVLKNGQGKVLLIRTDMDALPVTEQTDLAYASTVRVKDEDSKEVGVMHACGHDVHMVCFIGVARYLAEHRALWRGTAVLIGQPAEERGSGARAMLDDGLFSRFPRPDYALALHCDSTLETGKVGCRAGVTLANVDSVDIVLKGRGGHGAYPHTTIDPVVEAAQLILDLQTIISREISPTEPAVITVGSIHGGTKHNVIGDTCHVQLTVRSFTDQVRRHLLEAIRRKALAIAKSHRAPEPEVTISEGTPALENNAALVEQVLPALKRALGDESVVDSEPSMGGEDFSQYGRAGVPVFMFRLGAVTKKRLDRYKQLGIDPPSLHSSRFYPDPPETIQTGIAAMAAAALELLPRPK
jgi:hippurate hydrolase